MQYKIYREPTLQPIDCTVCALIDDYRQSWTGCVLSWASVCHFNISLIINIYSSQTLYSNIIFPVNLKVTINDFHASYSSLIEHYRPIGKIFIYIACHPSFSSIINSHSVHLTHFLSLFLIFNCSFSFPSVLYQFSPFFLPILSVCSPLATLGVE